MNEELATARGQVGVLRDLLMEALSIIDTIAAKNEDESYLMARHGILTRPDAFP